LNTKGSWATTPSRRRYAPRSKVAHVDAVDAHAPFGRGVEALEQLQQGRFPRSAFADDRHRPARGDAQVDPPEHRAAAAVAEGDVVQLEPDAEALERRLAGSPSGSVCSSRTSWSRSMAISASWSFRLTEARALQRLEQVRDERVEEEQLADGEEPAS